MSLIIRREKGSEYREAEHLVRESFWNVYRPGCMEHFVLHKLRDDAAFVPELDLVMLMQEEEHPGNSRENRTAETLIGQVMFMRAEIAADDGRKIPVMTMGPICVLPEFQGKGYGKILLEESLKRAETLGCGAVCIEGNIDFYGKRGFQPASAYGLRYHGMEEETPYFLCKELIPGYLDGVTGEYAAPDGYDVDEQETEEFDKKFPYKEKKKLPGQLF